MLNDEQNKTRSEALENFHTLMMYFGEVLIVVGEKLVSIANKNSVDPNNKKTNILNKNIKPIEAIEPVLLNNNFDKDYYRISDFLKTQGIKTDKYTFQCIGIEISKAAKENHINYRQIQHSNAYPVDFLIDFFIKKGYLTID